MPKNLSELTAVMPIGPSAQPYLLPALQSLTVALSHNMRLIIVLDGRQTPPEEFGLLPRNLCEIVENEHSAGVAGAMSTGLDYVDTEYFATVHSDDISHPLRFHLQLEFLSENSSVGVICSQYSDPRSIPTYFHDYEREFCDLRALGIETIPWFELLFHNPVTDPSTMYRTFQVHQAGGWTAGMRSMQDYDLLLRIAKFSAIQRVKAKLLGYRVHPGQHSRKGVNPWEWNQIARSRGDLSKARWKFASLGYAAHGLDLGRRAVLSARRRVGDFLGPA